MAKLCTVQALFLKSDRSKNMFWFAAILLVSVAHSQATPSEDVIDELILELDRSLIEKHQDTLPIPDIDKKIDKQLGLLKLHGEFFASGGYFRNVSTLRRTEPLDITQNDSKITLGISLGLTDLEFGFKKYRTDILNIGAHGEMMVTVGKNEVYGHLTIDMPQDGKCKTTIDKLEITKLEDFHLDMTGLKFETMWIRSYAVQLANNHHDKIAQEASKKLFEAATHALAKHDICDRIHF